MMRMLLMSVRLGMGQMISALERDGAQKPSPLEGEGWEGGKQRNEEQDFFEEAPPPGTLRVPTSPSRGEVKGRAMMGPEPMMRMLLMSVRLGIRGVRRNSKLLVHKGWRHG